jgi:hypothetical protein
MGNNLQIRLLRWIVLLLVILGSISPVFADTTAAVTIKMQFSMGIVNLTITYVSDTDMSLNWNYDPTLFENVMIRSSYVSYPTDITSPSETPSDGNLVYYGSGTSFNDTSMDFNQNAGPIYYKAWAQNLDGTWQVQTGTGTEESKELQAIMFTGLVLLLLVVGIWRKEHIEGMLLFFADAILWVMWSYYMYGQTFLTNTFMNTAFAMFGAGMALIAIVLFIYSMNFLLTSHRTKRPHTTSYDEEKAANRQHIIDITRRRY